jgi:hypothetical protein
MHFITLTLVKNTVRQFIIQSLIAGFLASCDNWQAYYEAKNDWSFTNLNYTWLYLKNLYTTTFI